MFFCGFIWIRAQDLLSRVIDVAIAPRSRGWRIVSNPARSPDIGDLAWSVAAEIPLVRPQFFVFIEVLRKKHIERQGLHTSGRSRKCGRVSPATTTAAPALTLSRLLSCRSPWLRPPLALGGGCRNQRRNRGQEDEDAKCRKC